MNIFEVKLGTRLEIDLINSLGEKIGKTYISQLMEIVDRHSIIMAAPIHESRLMFIPNGTRVRAVFLHEKYGLLSFEGVITHKEKNENILALHAEISTGFVKIQRRQYFRLECSLNGKYRLVAESATSDETKGGTQEKDETVKGSQQDFKKALTKNISGSGACIVIQEDIPKDSVIELVLFITPETTVNAVCKVVRSKSIETSAGKKYSLGLLFIEIPKKDQDIVIKYIFDKQRQLLKNNITDKI